MKDAIIEKKLNRILKKFSKVEECIQKLVEDLESNFLVDEKVVESSKIDDILSKIDNLKKD